MLSIEERNHLGTLGPDLSVPAVTSPAGAAVGTNVSVTYTVRNGGGQAANNFAVGFALAPLSDTSGASDVAIGPTIPVPVLAPGTSRTVSSVLFIPPSVAMALITNSIRSPAPGFWLYVWTRYSGPVSLSCR